MSIWLHNDHNAASPSPGTGHASLWPPAASDTVLVFDSILLTNYLQLHSKIPTLQHQEMFSSFSP